MSKEDNAPIEKLFGSKTRAKLLGLFFANVGQSYYVREITRLINEQINSVRRELLNLESIGVIKNETYDNKVYYSANMKHPYAHPFQEIFGKKVSTNTVVEVKRATAANVWDEYIRPVEKYLRGLVVTKKVPGQEGVDMLIIGDDRTKKLTRWAEIVEKRQGRPMGYVIMSRDDFLYRKSVRDRFLADILEMDTAEVYDPEHIIKE